jgi:hypothetical protein
MTGGLLKTLASKLAEGAEGVAEEAEKIAEPPKDNGGDKGKGGDPKDKPQEDK